MMPSATTGALATKLQRNWHEKFNGTAMLGTREPMSPASAIPRRLAPNATPISNGRDELDDSLTCLNWLHNINILNIGGSGGSPSSNGRSTTPTHSSMVYTEASKVNPNQAMGTSFKNSPVSSDCSDPVLNEFDFNKVTTYQPQGYEKVDYKANPYIKPPYSYATLICKAMKESKKSKITLSSIYNWITENFLYYRIADPSWQNSIRHNLSLNKCFQKVPRKKDEPGKGGFWQMNPDYIDALETGNVKKRKASPKDAGSPTPSKRKGKAGSSSEDSSSPLPTKSGYGKSKSTTETARNNTSLLPFHSSPADITPDDFSDLLGSDFPADFPQAPSGDDLELTVQGIKIEPPEWWCDSLDASSIRALVNAAGPIVEPDFSFTSPSNAHPWKTEKNDIDDAIAALDDMDKIFGSNY